MASRAIPDERVRDLDDEAIADGRYVLYWMQRSRRAEDAHALEWAVQRANERALPLVVGFGLTADYPDANARHHRFLLEGLAETSASVERRGATFALLLGAPDEVALALARDAALVVADRGDLRHQRA